MHQYIRGLQVAMHDVIGSQYLESLDQLLEILDDLMLGQASILPDFLIEGASIAKLIKEVKIIDGLEYLNEPDNIRRVDLGQHLYFIERAFLQFRIVFESFNIDDLHCHLLVISAIDAAVHLSVLPLADLFMQRVILDDLHHRYFKM